MCDANGQPVYVLQNMNSPALIPFQFQQPGGAAAAFPVAQTGLSGAHTTLTNSGTVPTVTIPSTLKVDGAGKSGHTLTLQTPPGPLTPKSMVAASTFIPKVEIGNLIQPKYINGGVLPSDVGPVRPRQLVKERPSPVAFDGE